MFRRLKIENYALIDSLDIELENGLTIVTGETGAGKSIVLGALSLLLGERADMKAIADGSAKSVVEAEFENVDSELRDIFDLNDLDWNSGYIIIRRDISTAGRSRAFVNDQPVTLSVLSEISKRLVNIHSQHSNLRIFDPRHQLRIIDAMSDDSKELELYKKDFSAYVALRGKIRRARAAIEEARGNREFLMFQLEQLDKLNPKKGELAEIERKFEMLSDADDLRERLRECLSLLSASERGCIDTLGEVRNLASGFDFSVFGKMEEDADVAGRLEQCYIELKDISETIEGCLDKVESDPAMLARMSARMNLYYETMKRFRIAEADELEALHKDIRNKLQEAENGGEEIEALEKEAREKGRNLKKLADQLSEKRMKGADALSCELTERARPLGLKNMEFTARLEKGKLTSDGQDTVDFLCSFNKNQTPQPLEKAASGGEISRLLLSLEGIMAEKMDLPTIIFDEIDTGVSGEIADRMGGMMQDMSESMQVLAITHLPQVAARGKSHFKVYKEDTDSKTISRMRKLGSDDRIREIAGMLSGSEVNAAAVENAKVLLGLK